MATPCCVLLVPSQGGNPPENRTLENIGVKMVTRSLSQNIRLLLASLGS